MREIESRGEIETRDREMRLVRNLTVDDFALQRAKRERETRFRVTEKRKKTIDLGFWICFIPQTNKNHTKLHRKTIKRHTLTT